MSPIDHRKNGASGAPERHSPLMDLHAKLARVEAKTEAVAEDVKEVRISIDKLTARDGEIERALANHALVTEKTVNGIADRFETMLRNVTDGFSEKIRTLNHDAFKRSDLAWVKSTATALLAAALAGGIAVMSSHVTGRVEHPVEIVTHP